MPTEYMGRVENERLLRLRDVMDATGLSRATIYRRAKNGTFPKPVKLGPRTNAWPQSKIQAWIQAQLHSA